MAKAKNITVSTNYSSQKALPKKISRRIRPNDIVELKWHDVNSIELVLTKPSDDDSILTFCPTDQKVSRVELAQVVSVKGRLDFNSDNFAMSQIKLA